MCLSSAGQVWPHILGVFPVGCSEEEKQSILSQAKEDYQIILKQWKVVETRQKEIRIRAAMVTNGYEETRSPSPTLSSVSASSAETSPTRSPPSVSRATGQTISEDSSPHNGLSSPRRPIASPRRSHDNKLKSHDPETQVDKVHQTQLDAKGEWFIRELFNIDKDIPRCDREYW